MFEKLSVKSSASGNGTVLLAEAELAEREIRRVCRENVEKIFIFGGAGICRQCHRLTRKDKLS
ncbi:hypothetical protein LF95_00160 [Thalassospira sp. TSL5-1]|nr:hypothetical protein LF95_00160 [Thalassospira sp. TSL5-1]